MREPERRPFLSLLCIAPLSADSHLASFKRKMVKIWGWAAVGGGPYSESEDFHSCIGVIRNPATGRHGVRPLRGAAALYFSHLSPTPLACRANLLSIRAIEKYRSDVV